MTTRRELFKVTGSAALGVMGAATLGSSASATLLTGPSPSGNQPVYGQHTTFGAQPWHEVTISWVSTTPVHRPRVRVGFAHSSLDLPVPARTVRYVDGLSKREVFCHHAALRALPPDTQFVYRIEHGDAEPVGGTFRTAPLGPARFRFTSFGDQATPVAGDALASPHAGDIVAQLETTDPLFHLMNGDLCYANLDTDRLSTWRHWFDNNVRSMRNRPWMPAAGNHENELGNGPIGYAAYQAYFDLPTVRGDAETQGLWYAYTVGSVRFVHLANDDVCYQDAGSSYVRGYSGGAQKRWLEKELRATRCNPLVDWIVVCMHQVVISSADFNGADLGIREEFAPLFDRYGVDLVVCGHEHHYERSHPVRGVVGGSPTLTPRTVSTDTRRIDTSKGTVHMILGGGGTSAPSNQFLYTPAKSKIVVGAGPAGANGKRPSIVEFEQASWSSVRDAEHAYGFASFDVDPGVPGGKTSISVKYYDALGAGPTELAVFDSFVLEKPRKL